jgi:hypothetical protein
VRMIGSLPSFRFSRSPALTFAGFLVVLWLAYQAAQLVLEDDIPTLGMSALVFVGLAVVVGILNDWRRGVYLLLTWIVFEDLVRKFLGNNMAIFFGKDILALVVYLSFFISRRSGRTKIFKPPFLLPLLFFLWYGIIQVFNPASTSIFYGILGMKIDFLYIPLMFVGYGLIETDEDLRQFFAYNSVLVLVVVGLGIIQAVLGHTFLNPAVLQEQIRDLSTTYRVSPITGAIAYRPTSVFVSAGRLQDFLLISWLVALGFGGYLLLRSKKNRLLAFITVAVVGVGSIMSASRGVFLWTASSVLVVVAAFLWGSPWRQGEARRTVRAIMRGAIFAAVALFLMMTFLPEQVGSRFAIYNETLSPNSPASELIDRTRDYPWHNFMLAFQHERWPYGYGIGTASLGVQYVARIMHAPTMNIGVENGYGQLVVEMGVLGLLFWIILSLSVAVSAWKVVVQLKGTPWFPIGFVIFWYAFLLMIPITYFGFVAYQDFIMNAYLWMLLGILFRLPTLVKEETHAQAMAQQAVAPRQA